MKKQTFCIGDIHGELEKLKNCFAKANPNKGDRLIFLGDLVDRGPDSYGVIEFVINLKKDYEVINLLGNHDDCWLNSVERGDCENGLLWREGAKETYQSYKNAGVRPQDHMEFFKSHLLYHIDEERNYFVHGGFNRHYPITEQPDPTVFLWDRDLFMCARSYKAMEDNPYPFKIHGKPKEVFIGHTPVQLWKCTTPLNAANIWNIDTGCGKYPDGFVTIMNIKTKEYFQA